MAKRDGKDKFYRTLDLDNETKKILRWFRDLKQEMINDLEMEEEDGSDQN